MVHVNCISSLASPFLAIYQSGFLEVQGAPLIQREQEEPGPLV